MDKYHLHWFTDEIYLHSSSAIASYQHLLHLLGDTKTSQSRDIWFVLLSFLTHAAMVSKFLDPVGSDKDKKERGEMLRGYLGVPSDSPILPRDARNNLEHIDERIDRWAQRGDTKIMEMVFDDRAGFDYIYESGGAIRRVLIAEEMIFISEDHEGRRTETALRPVFDSLSKLHSVCSEKLRTDSPYHYRLAQALKNYSS